MPTIMKALIYTRVSADRAQGRSPAEQEAEAREVCAREQWEVTEVVTDSVGASRHSKGTRKGWAHACRIVKAGEVDVLVTWEASRAQRDLAAYTELRSLCASTGVRWSYSGRTYDLTDHDDRFRTGLDALMAEREADEIAHRVQRAIRSNAIKGRPHGRRLYGYQRVYDANSGALVRQEPHPVEAPIVARIFQDYLAGKGIRTIAADLNAAGITTSSEVRHVCTPSCRAARHPGVPKASWSDSQLRAILVNPAYVSRRVHRGEVIGDADWPPLVEVEVFERVQARLAAKRTYDTRQTRNANLLSGVARCGICGGKMGRGHDRNHRKTYICKTKFCVARDLTKLDDFLTRVVLARLAKPDVVDGLAGGAPDPAVQIARDRADELRQQLDDAIDEFTAGNLTAATLAKIEATLKAQVEAAERQVRQAAVPLEIEVPQAGQLEDWWETLTPEMRREVVTALIQAVVVLPTKRGSRTFDPNAVKIEWRYQ